MTRSIPSNIARPNLGHAIRTARHAVFWPCRLLGEIGTLYRAYMTNADFPRLHAMFERIYLIMLARPIEIRLGKSGNGGAGFSQDCQEPRERCLVV